MDPRVVEIARRLHSNSCYWCQLGSPRCDGSPTGIEFRRAADWLAMARMLARAGMPVGPYSVPAEDAGGVAAACLDALEDVSATAAASAAAIRHHLAAQPA